MNIYSAVSLLLVGSSGLEPPTSRLSGARSNHLSYEPIQFLAVLFPCPRGFTLFGGDDGIRTHDPLLAGQVLSQLSYTPISLDTGLSCFFQLSSLSKTTVPENRTTSDLLRALTLTRLIVCFCFFFDFCLLCFKQVTFSIERR